MKLSLGRTFSFTFGAFLWISSGCLGMGTSRNSTDEDNSEVFLLNLMWECTKTESIGTCLKSKAANILDKFVRMKEPIPITDYLSLARDPKAEEITEEDVNNSKGEVETNSLEEKEEEEKKDDKLDKIIWNKLTSLLKTRTIQFTFPSNIFEGRGSKGDKIFKKGHGIFLMAGMMGGMMMKMAMAKIALIAGKALIIGKIALILSLIIALKKFVGNGGGGGGPEVVYASAEQGADGWQRRFKLEPLGDHDGAHLAYNAHHSRHLKNL